MLLWVLKVEVRADFLLSHLPISRTRVALPYSRPEKVGVDEKRLSKAWQIVEMGARNGAFAGAVALVAKDGRVILHKSCGYQMIIPRCKKLLRDSIFDLASVTKAVATTTSILILIERGMISLDARVSSIIPSFNNSKHQDNEVWRDEITIEHLLTHTSGLPPWYEFYSQVNSKDELIEELCTIPLSSKPGTSFQYSDLGFILLGVIVENITGSDLSKFAKENIFTPLGMVDTSFNPFASKMNRIVATEFSNWRRKMVQGEVHDENAYVMGGVSGHAGLFSTATDLMIFCQCLLDGTFKGQRILSDDIITRMRTDRAKNLGGNVGLGWRIRSEGNVAKTLAIGSNLSPYAFGHNGYTGTSVWMDPKDKLTLILLTNRVHPIREGDPSIDKSVGIMMKRKSTWRNVNQAFQNAVVDSLVR